ncbi:MAG: DNA polymerase III subunit alpha [Verrucomicrobiota bacterium]
MSGFVHLNVHSMYSMLEAPCRVPDLVKSAKETGMEALALTDLGNMFGAIEFYQKAQSAEIKPILGAEICLDRGKQGHGSLILLTRNDVGYVNLMKIVTHGHLESEGSEKKVPLDMLRDHRDGLIALSGGRRGEITQLIINGLKEEAEALATELKSVWGPDDFYLEIQDHGLTGDGQLRQELVALSQRLHIPLVATNDVFYVKKDHAQTHDILSCIRTSSRIDDADREVQLSSEFYLKSEAEMRDLFQDVPEAIANTVKIAERCDLNLEFGVNKYPAYPVEKGVEREAYLRELCHQGLRQRFGDQVDTDPELTERLDYELGIIEKMGFVSYFLIVWDFIRYAKENGIPVGPGRGSGAGSMVAYVLEITDLDPIRYGLIFERFLNPERVSPPDIDVDFCQDRRAEVIHYVREKYGQRSVAQIVTYGTMGAKMAVRDVARVMGMSFGDASRIADMIPKDPKITIEKAMVENPEFKTVYDSEDEANECINHALQLEGMARQTGTHAAGVVIADGELTEHMPLTRDDHGNIMTQYSMGMLESVGMLKMDFLGLKTLTVIQNAVDFIQETRGIKIDPLQLPLDDPATYELLNQGRNVGVFQVESPGMRKLCRQFDVSSVDDIIALIALYRPGPMELIPDYIACKKGEKEVTYDHPLLEEISKETYGFLIYQEQVMKAAQLLAGYSLGEADLFRRAMGKKKKEVMDQQRERFIQGCAELNQIPKKKATDIFALLEKFAGYGFNKSHSAAYGIISYQTAYLKANYPTHFLCALLCNDLDNTDKISLFISEAREMGIDVLCPSINKSAVKFSIEGDSAHASESIRYGMAAIKNVGVGVSEAIVSARQEGGPFQSMADFCSRVDFGALNRRTIEALVKSGAFDEIHPNRAGMMELIEPALARASSDARDRAAGQSSLFDDGLSDDLQSENTDVLEKRRLWPKAESLQYEKELLGCYFSGHPIDEFEFDLRAFRSHQTAEVAGEVDRAIVRLAGLISAREVRIAKKSKKPFARLVVEDRVGTVEAMVWPDTYAQFGEKLEPGTPIVLTCQIERSRQEEAKVVPYQIQTLDELCPAEIREVYLVLSREECEPTHFAQIQKVTEDHHGPTPLCLVIPGEKGGAAVMESGQRFHLDLRYPVLKELRKKLGPEKVKLRVKDPDPAPKRKRYR